ncbi:MAG: nitroreductase family protein [Clostridia bacterium]|nr:nitroreductase family protein [Clostridia bacterium]
MDFEKICKERYSVRSFSSKPVEDEKIAKILEMVRLSPTARNNQPYEILYAKTPEAIEKLKVARDGFFGAPLVFLICSIDEKRWHNRQSGREFTLQDIGIVATTLMYACTEVGLGSVYVCAFDPIKAKEGLNLDGITPECMMVVGYPSDDAKPSQMHLDRRNIEEFAKEIK